MTSRVPNLVVLALLAALLMAGAPADATVHQTAGAVHAKKVTQKHVKKHQRKHKKKRPVRQQAKKPVRTKKPVPMKKPARRGGPGDAEPGARADDPDGRPARWISTRDEMRRVDALSPEELMPSSSTSAVHVTVDDATRYQAMDGYGAALTESSAHLLMGLSPSARTAALRSLFDPVDGAGIDLVRLPLGASDFALSRYTYDDVPAGQTDPSLARFSIAHDEAELLPVLEEAKRINPSLRVMATPWSAPAWMKTNKSLLGGTLADG